MNIEVKQAERDLHVVLITIVGNDGYAKLQLNGNLANHPAAEFIISDELRVDWDENQVSPFDWLKDALIAYIEKL